MKLKHILLTLFVVLLCVVAINTAEEASAVSYAYINHNLGSSNQMEAGGTITFTFNTDGTRNALYVYKMASNTDTQGSEYYTIADAPNPCSIIIRDAGRYQALVQAWDGSGALMSSRITFYVGLPTKATISLNRNSIRANQSIEFTMVGDGAQNNLWIYKSDKTTTYKLVQNAGGKQTITFDTPGIYYARMETWNGKGSKLTDLKPLYVAGSTLGASLSTSTTSGKIVNGNLTYTIKITNNTYVTVTNINLQLKAKSSSKDYTIYALTNGDATQAHGASGKVKSGDTKSLAHGATLEITITLDTTVGDYINEAFTISLIGISGTQNLGSGSYSATASCDTTHKFTPARGSVSISWSSSVDSNSYVLGTYTYTVTFKNSTNHTITGIDYTIKIGNTEIVTVTDGTAKAKQTYVKVGNNATQVSLGDVSGNNGTVSLKVTIDTTGMNANASYTFTLSSGTCTSSDVVNAYNLTASAPSSNTHSIKVPGGTVTATVTGQPTTNGKIVAGEISYTIKIHNGTNFDIKNISFKFGNSTVNILTVTNGVVQQSGYVKSAKNVSNTLKAGADMNITFTFNTANLTGTEKYTLQVLNSSSVNNTAFAVGDPLSRSFNSTTHDYYVANGTLSATVSQANPNGNPIGNGAIAAGHVVYTVTITNGTNYQVNGINMVVKISNSAGNSTLINIVNGSISGTKHKCYHTSSNLGSNFTIDAGKTRSFTVTIDVSHESLDRDTTYTVSTVSASCSASNLASGYSKTGITISDSTSNPSVKTNKGEISISWVPSIDSGKVVEGVYKYVITFKNTSNHAIKGITFTLSEGSTPLVTVSGGSVTVDSKVSNYVSVDKSTLGDSNKVLAAVNGEVTLEITIDTTKLSDGSSHTYTLSNATCNANGIQGGSSTYQLTANAGYTHSFTVREGDISVSLKAESVNGSNAAVTMVNGGVAEDKVVYTITLTNGTNHNLKNIVIILKDNSGNALITFSGGALTKNSDLVTTTGTVTVNGKVTTISGITVNAKDASLDPAGQLIVHVESDATSSDVVGSGENYAYDADTGAFTIMVRHDVNVLVQAGKVTTVPGAAIRAAMAKSGATMYNGIGDITAVYVTDINGNEVTGGNITRDGNNLVFTNLSNEYTEFIIKIEYAGGSVLVPIQVSTLSSGQDKVFVLNYSLPVTMPISELLNGLNFNGGAYTSTTFSAIGLDNDFIDEAVATFAGTFGNFDFTAENVKYTNTKIMTDGDAVYLVIRVTDSNSAAEPAAYVDYVDLYKKITIIPGNVIYYEDSLIDSIIYPLEFEIETLGQINNTSTSATLPLDPGTNSFDDGTYQESQGVEHSGLGVHKVPVYDEQVTVKFTFTGTGFELLSRVNAFDSATILVKVRPHGGTDADWTWYPVITQFDPNGNGLTEVYQVPVFRLNNGNFGTYDVEIVGLPKAANDNYTYDDQGNPTFEYEVNYIYIDGIRVYNPLGYDDPLTENYGNEKNAEFTNLRDLILEGKGLVTMSENGKLSSFTSGSFYYTPDNNGKVTAAMGGINELGAIGANNEILIRKSEGDNMIVLYVNETINGSGLLQIGIHDVHDDKFDGGNGNNVPTTVKILNANMEWVDLATGIQHGAELYYNIDLSNCPVENGNKVVMLKVESGFASFTNVKHKGITFEAVGAPALDAFVKPGYYFNAKGDMCEIVDGEEKVKIPAAELTNMGILNSMLAEIEPEEEITE